MTEYIFELEEVKAKLQLKVLAQSRAEAVSRANNLLQMSEGNLWGSGIDEPDFSSADWETRIEPELVEKQIVHEYRLPIEELVQAHQLLGEAGYDYQGSFETLKEDETPLFMKVLWTEEGRSIDSLFRVRGRFDRDLGRYNFKVEGVLYPFGRGDLKQGEAFYTVEFSDRQYNITTDVLLLAVHLYEAKFFEMIKILRQR